jgi:hypothetical protein
MTIQIALRFPDDFVTRNQEQHVTTSEISGATQYGHFMQASKRVLPLV